MATIRGLPDLQNAPALRGRFLVDVLNGKLRVRRWPRKRGKPKSQKQRDAIQWFTEANRLAKYTWSLDQWMAIELTKQSGLYPRDIIMSAMAGRLFETLIIDGQEYVSVAVKDDVSWNLDLLGKTTGDLLVRGQNQWQPIPAGASGDVLTSNGPEQVPTWQPGGGGGGGGFVQPFAANFPRLKSNISGLSITDTEGGILITSGTLTSGRFGGYIGQAIGSPPWTVETVIWAPLSPFAPWKWRGLCVQDAAENRCAAIPLYQAGTTAAGSRIESSKFLTWFTNPQNSSKANFIYQIVDPLESLSDYVWFRITNDGTFLRFYVSNNGVQWTQQALISVTSALGGAAAFVGYWFYNTGASGKHTLASPHWKVT